MDLLSYLPRTSQEIGLFIIRVGIGAIFVAHGFPKLTGGMEKWIEIGSAMKSLGITFAPAAWGFAAACSEFFGGIALIIGLYPQIASFFIGCVMAVALTMHIANGDSFMIYSHPLSILIVMVGLVAAHL